MFASRLLTGLALCGAAVLSPAALADGSGTLSDSALSLDYSSPAITMLNPVTLLTGTQICEEGTPVCDVYTLNVNLSDAFRADPDNAQATIDIIVSSDGDFDLYVNDASGNQLFAAEETGDEKLTLSPDELPNGTYKLVMIPFEAVQASASLGIAVGGLETKSSGLAAVLGGALAPGLLLPLVLLAGRRAVREKLYG